MLTVSGLSKSYGKQVLFEDGSFQGAPGERGGLVGRNGHGKTTLFRILLGEESADGGTIAVPSGYRIGHLAQRLEFPRPTVLEEAASALLRREDGTDEHTRRNPSGGAGFDDADLSRGGRVSEVPGAPHLAGCSCPRPDLLCWTPTNYLDIAHPLAALSCALEGALVLITHDRDFMTVSRHTRDPPLRSAAQGGTGSCTAKPPGEMIHEQSGERRAQAQEAEAFINGSARRPQARAVQSRIKLLAATRARKAFGDPGLVFRSTRRRLSGSGCWRRAASPSVRSRASHLIEMFSLAVGGRPGRASAEREGETTLLRLLAG
jgi:ATP-binding cassette subfamily F protein 3